MPRESVEMGVSPGGIDMMPVSVESRGSVMIVTTDSDVGRGVSPGGMLMTGAELPASYQLSLQCTLGHHFGDAHMGSTVP